MRIVVSQSRSENSRPPPPLVFVAQTAAFVSPAGNTPPGRVVSAAFFLLVLLVSSADVKRVTSDRIHWVAMAAFLAIATPMLVRSRWKLNLPIVFAGALMTLAVVGSGWSHPVYSLLEAGKLASILILFALLLINHPQLAHTGFRALEVAVWLNVLCLATLLFDSGPFASLMAPGRWGTVLNAPGSLWRVGASTLIIGAYGVCAATKFPLRSLGLCGASILLIYADGSRTAIILLLSAVPFLAIFAFREFRRRTRAVRMFLVAAALGACVLGFVDLRRQALATDRNLYDALLRVAPIWQQVTSLDGEDLPVLDVSRYEMLHTVIERLRENPIWGDGIGGTRVHAAGSDIVVHMSYLQVWSDLGVIGFLGYVWISFFWVPQLRRAKSRIHLLANADDRALYANAVFVLLVFCASAFFHPLSTEFPEWLPFLMASALFLHLVSAVVNPAPAPTIRQAPDAEAPASRRALPV
jgi:hypothetical protein